MTEQLSLFAPVGAASPSADVARLADEMRDGIYLGTSSWSFPGWEGIVYDSKVSQSTLARHGLQAYARHPLFRTVCIDRTYYGPITAEDFARYARAVPENFRFVVKAHELVTSARLKDDFQSANPSFLDPAYALEEVIGPCMEGLGGRAAVLLLQFPPQRIDSAEAFSEKLARFLGELPKELLYATELRNPELLNPGYLEALRSSGACHCFNVHPTMPSIAEQVRQAEPSSFPAVVVRWMLRRNLTYGDAKDAFYPFDKIAKRDDTSRAVIAKLCRDAKRAFVIVNNKAEGCAPLSLVELAKEILRHEGTKARRQLGKGQV